MGEQISPVFKQFLAIVCCNLLTMSVGQVSGWATINFNELQSKVSTLPSGPISLKEASLVVSFFSIGGFVGNFAILPVTHLIGAKQTAHILGIPLIVSTLLIIFAQNVFFLYASRLLGGFVLGSLIICIPTLINDISNDDVRGSLNSLFDPFNNIGIIVSFFLGNYLSWLDQAKFQLIIPSVFIIVMFFLPNSAEYWIKRNKEKRAVKSNKFYKGNILELEKIEFLQSKEENTGKENKEKNTDETNSDSKLTLKDFFTPHAKKASFIAFTSLTLSFLSGTITIVSFVTDIFTRTGSALSEKNSSILMSIAQIVANLVFLNIVERVNRRTLLIWSCFLATASFFLFAAYCQFWFKDPAFEWMPPLCFACIVFTSCMGLLPIPYIITIEIFPKKIRQTCLALAVSFMWVTLFIVGSVFPIFLEYFGLVCCMVTLGIMCLTNAIFGILYVPETRGKSYEEIMELLNK